MTAPDPAVIADAFGLGDPLTELMPAHDATPTRAWCVETTTGAYVVKRVRSDEPDWWMEIAERNVAFERLAIAAGVDVPEPVTPREPVLGLHARVDDRGPVRVYRFVEGRPLQPDDDIATWLGGTLATLNRLQPGSRCPDADYGIHPIDDWRGWFEQARALDLTEIADLGEANIDGIDAATRFVADALASVDDYVVTHRDVEPWNVLITDDRPVLLDFDWVGADSAWLVAAWAAIAYASHEREQPDLDRARAVIDSYVGAGGQVTLEGPAAFARRVALRLIRQSYNLWIVLEHRPAPVAERRLREAMLMNRLGSFPSLLSDVERWADAL